MKKLSLSLLLFILIFPSFAQTPSWCTVNPILRAYYQDDVTELTIKQIYQTESVYMDSIPIPEIIEDSIWKAMAAIFNVSSIPERDSVFDKYCIHTKKDYFIDEMLIIYYPDTAWTESWQNEEITTGIHIIDSLLSLYEFEIIHTNPESNLILLKTQLKINIRPLTHILVNIDGIQFADPNIQFGGANRILYNVEDGIRYLDFSKRWGDCFSGCAYNHTFKFKVFPDCSVEYLGTVMNWNNSDPLGEPNNCDITGIDDGIPSSNSFYVYPNPTSDALTVGFNSIDQFEFIIWSYTAKKLKSGTLYPEIPISLSGISSGIYLLEILNLKNNTRSIHKFIKQ